MWPLTHQESECRQARKEYKGQTQHLEIRLRKMNQQRRSGQWGKRKTVIPRSKWRVCSKEKREINKLRIDGWVWSHKVYCSSWQAIWIEWWGKTLIGVDLRDYMERAENTGNTVEKSCYKKSREMEGELEDYVSSRDASSLFLSLSLSLCFRVGYFTACFHAPCEWCRGGRKIDMQEGEGRTSNVFDEMRWERIGSSAQMEGLALGAQTVDFIYF